MRYPPFTILLIALLLLAIGGYTAFQARNLVIGPTLSVEAPANGERVAHPLVTIEGSAENIAFLRLNDRQIFLDEYGTFTESLLLAPGYTILTLRAEDRFGRTEVRRLELVYDPSPSSP